MKDSAARMFFVSDDGNKKKKVSKSDLQAAIDSGKHSEKTLAWTIGMGPAWLRLSDPFWRKYGIIIRSDCHPRPPANRQARESSFSKHADVTIVTESESFAPVSQEASSPAELTSKKQTFTDKTPATNVPEKKKELERPSPVGGKTFKIYEHPYYKPKVIKLGFSWLAFFFHWIFFFYHKCFKAGTIYILGIGVFVFLEAQIQSDCFYNFKQNDDSYQYLMELRSELDTTSLLYYNSEEEIEDLYYSKFLYEYEWAFVLSGGVFYLLYPFFWAKRASLIIEKTLLSKGYTQVFETKALNSSHALAVYHHYLKNCKEVVVQP